MRLEKIEVYKSGSRARVFSSGKRNIFGIFYISAPVSRMEISNAVV